MQDFIYRQIDDGSNCLIKYRGDEAEVVIPDNRDITVLYDKLFSCCKEHDVSFCGLCNEFPCNWLKSWFDGWNKNGIERLINLKNKYSEYLK